MCTSPLKGFQIGYTDKGKPDYVITSYKCDHIEYNKKHWIKVYEKLKYKPKNGKLYPIYSPYTSRIVTKYIDIPCGYCDECRLKYAQTWANRIMLESKYHDHNYFVTLTYRDGDCIVNSIGQPCLNIRDVQLFMKRLRKKYGECRFFMCGEYGDSTMRPHYHMIIFGLDIPDLTFYKLNFNNDVLYTSPSLEKLWKHGYVVIGNLTWEAAAYTARYVVKKAHGKDSDWYLDHELTPEFVNMSRRPGIGYMYFDDNYKRIYETDEIILSTNNGGKKIKPPRYFDNKLEQINPVLYEQIKNTRKTVFESCKKLMLLQTNLTYDMILKNREYVLKQKLKILKRDL